MSGEIVECWIILPSCVFFLFSYPFFYSTSFLWMAIYHAIINGAFQVGWRWDCITFGLGRHCHFVNGRSRNFSFVSFQTAIFPLVSIFTLHWEDFICSVKLEGVIVTKKKRMAKVFQTHNMNAPNEVR